MRRVDVSFGVDRMMEIIWAVGAAVTRAGLSKYRMCVERSVRRPPTWTCMSIFLGSQELHTRELAGRTNFTLLPTFDGEQKMNERGCAIARVGAP